MTTAWTLAGWNRVSGSKVNDFGRAGSGHGSDLVFDPVLSFNMCVYRWQTYILSFGSVLITDFHSTGSLTVFQLMPVIFTYLRADCVGTSQRFWICRHLRYYCSKFENSQWLGQDGSGRVTIWVKNPDPVPSLGRGMVISSMNNCFYITLEQGWKMAPNKPRFFRFLKKPKKPEKSKI